MSTMQPYEAWYFFAADNVDEVNAEYQKMLEPPVGDYYIPDLAHRVMVVAAEIHRGSDYIWAIREGKLDRFESWLVRKFP